MYPLRQILNVKSNKNNLYTPNFLIKVKFILNFKLKIKTKFKW